MFKIMSCSSIHFHAFFALLLLAAIADGRKDPGEYWASLMKEEPIPKAIQGLIHVNNELTPRPGRKTDHDCKTSTTPTNQQNPKSVETTKNYNDEFEPRPNLSAYGEDKDNNKLEKKQFIKDFEPRPNLSAYGDADKLEGEKSNADDFESRPRAKSDADDAELKGEKPFVKDFEPRPNISIYKG